MEYHFANYRLRPDSRELLDEVGAIDMEPGIFDLILHFVRNPARVLTQDELIEAVWKGVMVSDSAISARISAARAVLKDDGKKQAVIKTHPRRGFSFILPVKERKQQPESAQPDEHAINPEQKQTIHFCISKDGTHIAYAKAGQGYPLVRVGHWLTHLEHDWTSPLWQPFLTQLCRSFELIRYDQRGNGLSDWQASEMTLDHFTQDLEAVIEAAKLTRFALYGTSQGCPVAINYAKRHPDKVSHLILHGGYQVGRLLRPNAQEREEGKAMLTFIRQGWGQPDGPFLQAFASLFIPDGTKEQIDSLTELQRMSTSPDNAARIREAVDHFDVSRQVKDITVPTLVIHARNDGVQPLSQGRALAAAIANAQVLLLDSRNHVLLEQETAWKLFFDQIKSFIRSNAIETA